MSTTFANPVSVLEEDFGARPTVWVINGLYVWPAYVVEPPTDKWGMMRVVYHHTIEHNEGWPFTPASDMVLSDNVKETKEEAQRAVLREALRVASRLTDELYGGAR